MDELIEKHQSDLAVQEKYGVKFKGMWVNKNRGTVFCLMEGPDKEACHRVHQEAHGDEGCNIIEVSAGDVTEISRKLLRAGRKEKFKTTQLTYDLLEKETTGDLKLNNIVFLSQSEEKMLYRLSEIVEDNMDDPDFSVEKLARSANLSRAQLFRRLRKLTGFTPNAFIREIRLLEAFDQLRKNSDQIAQIAFNTGFNSPSYFAKSFAKRFKILPSEYVNSLKR